MALPLYRNKIPKIITAITTIFTFQKSRRLTQVSSFIFSEKKLNGMSGSGFLCATCSSHQLNKCVKALNRQI